MSIRTHYVCIKVAVVVVVVVIVAAATIFFSSLVVMSNLSVLAQEATPSLVKDVTIPANAATMGDKAYSPNPVGVIPSLRMQDPKIWNRRCKISSSIL